MGWNHRLIKGDINRKCPCAFPDSLRHEKVWFRSNFTSLWNTFCCWYLFCKIGYVLFLFWLTLTTESGPKNVPTTHPDFVDLAAALAQGFAIQTFFIPILKKNPNQKLYKKMLGITYVIGTIIYLFIAYSGAYSKSLNKDRFGESNPI